MPKYVINAYSDPDGATLRINVFDNYTSYMLEPEKVENTIFSIVTSGTAKSEVSIQDTRFLSASEISVGSNSDFKIGSTFSCSKSVANVTEICFRWFFTSIVR